MLQISFSIRQESTADIPQIELLHADAFGPGRFARAAFLIREGFPVDSRLCFVAHCGEELVGSVRLTPILLGEAAGQLLGPLTVKPTYKNKGIGRALLRHAVNRAREIGEKRILLVGDMPYYSPFGFNVLPSGLLKLPAPVDPARLLVADLSGNAIEDIGGVVRGRYQIES
ncbi:MAG: N-acetyltransferase [Stappiaceae bacterium]